MIKKTILAVAMAAAASTALANGGYVAAPAQNNYNAYAGVRGGMNFIRGKDNDGFKASDVFKNGWNLGGYLGYQFMPNFRADISYDYIRNDVKDADSYHANQNVIMGNVYYDITQFGASSMVPYVGGGLGWDRLSDNAAGDDSVNAFAWQVGGGVNYNFSHNIGLGLGYRLLAAHKDGNTLYNNLINAGLTYHFAM